MAQLFSSQSEVLAIRGICSKDRAISGYLLANLDESYFHEEPAVEAYEAIIKYMGKHGTPPAFTLLAEDLSVTTEARDFLALGGRRQIKTSAQAEQLIHTLSEYRKTRLLFKLSKGIIRKLQQDQVDVEALVEQVTKRIIAVSSIKSTDNSLFHIGTNSNVGELVEEIIFGTSTDHVIPTGFKAYDEINGGFKRGSLVLCGGGTGSGKCGSYDTQVTLPTLEITLEGKDGEDVTLEAEPSDHVLVRRGGASVWIEAQHLREEDSVVIDSDELEANLLLIRKS